MVDGLVSPAPGLRRWTSRLRRAVRHDGVFWRWAAYMGSTHLPEWLRRHSPPWFGTACYLALGSRRRAVIDNLRHIHGPRGPVRDQIDACKTFVEFARCLTDSLETTVPDHPAYEVRVEGRQALLDHLHAKKGGAVLLTAHIGSWEVIARLLARKMEAPVAVVMAREQNFSTRAFAEQIRGRTGVRVIYADESVLSVLTMLRAVREGSLLAIQIDRPTGGRSDRPVRLFGVDVPFPLGPFRLAQAAGVPLFQVFAIREGHRRYAVRLEEPIRIEGRGEAAAVQGLRQAVLQLETAIRERPHQWFQFQPIANGAKGANGAARPPDYEIVPHISGRRAR